MLSDKVSDAADAQGGTGQAQGKPLGRFGEGPVVVYHKGRRILGLNELAAMPVLP